MPITTLKHGSILDTVSREEMRQLLQEFTIRQQTRERVRATAVVVLDANGLGEVNVYTAEPGWELEVRRLFFDNSVASEGNLAAGSINLSTPGQAVQYLRSGTRIEWGNPIGPLATTGRIPGTQTWGNEQGPYLRNGEVFQVRLLAGVAFALSTLTVTMEGIITKGGSLK